MNDSPQADDDDFEESPTEMPLPRLSAAHVGKAPGIEPEELARMPSREAGRVVLTCIDYSPTQALQREITDLPEFIATHRPAWSEVRWIDVAGLSDLSLIQQLATKYQLHPLAVEDLLQTSHRAKYDTFGGDDNLQARLFITVRTLEQSEGKLDCSQASMFLGHKTVLTFTAARHVVWDAIRQRLQKPGSRLRRNDASFLVYALLDAIIDHGYPILEQFGDQLQDLEGAIVSHPDDTLIERVHALNRQLLLLRRELWPLRELVHNLREETHECLSEETRTYFRDAADHTVQIMDLVETYHELANNLINVYMTVMSNRLNESMKILTMISTIFIPLSFLAGVYGMNFEMLPELKWQWSYPLFWAICLTVAGTMLFWFRRNKWI